MSGILSATFDHYCWLLRPVLNLHVYLPFLRTGAIVNGYMPLSKWILSPSFGGTFGNFRSLSLTTSTCVNLHRDLYHYLERALSPTCEHYNVNEHPRNPSGYFSVTFDHYHWLLRLASRHLPRYRQLVNIVMLINTLAILRGYFGNFRPLSLTTWTCVNLDIETYHYFERAVSSTCKHYNVNEHPRNPSGYFW